MFKKLLFALCFLTLILSCNKESILNNDIIFIGKSRKIHDYIDPMKGISRSDTLYPDTVKVLERADSIFFTLQNSQSAFKKNNENNYSESQQGLRASINFQLSSTDSLKYIYSYNAQSSTLYRISITFNGNKQ